MAPIFTGSKFGFGRSAAGGGSGISATGGNVSALAPGNGYIYYTFTSPGYFTVTSGGNFEVLMVAGGGGGGWYAASGNGGGGGGAGGLVYVPLMPITSGSYLVTVGGGGNSARLNGTQAGSNGDPTTFNGFTALGGGFGAGYTVAGPVGPNGSGGTGNGAVTPADQPTQPQPLPAPSYFQYGNPSGAGSAPTGIYDGGGGAGGPGSTPTANPPGSPGLGGTYGGGLGRQYPQFLSTLIGLPNLYPVPQQPIQDGWFAGGGGGGGYNNPDSSKPWGSGVGGGGGTAIGPDGTGFNSYNAVENTGGGGAGGANGGFVGKGGSGIVIIRHLE